MDSLLDTKDDNFNYFQTGKVRLCIKCINCMYILLLEVTIARKMLPHPKGLKAACTICLIRGCLYDPALPADMRQDDFDVLK